jgi:hypothetical protein
MSRRTRQMRRHGQGHGRRVDVPRGVPIAEASRFYDPPWRSLPEGRGLPYTPVIRAMLPVTVLMTALVLALVFGLAAVAMLVEALRH